MLRLVARGLSHKEIATQLVISPKTARNHIEHIYVKIGASNRTTASLFAMQHGLLPDDVRRRPERPRRWGNCPMRRDGLHRYLRLRIEVRRGEATMSLRGKFFAATYDRQIAKTEKAGLRALRDQLLAAAAGDVLEIGGGTGANLPSTELTCSR